VKITLIYPGIAGYGFSSLGQGMGAGWINHGLAQLSACIKAEGFEVNLIDLRALSGWDHLHTELVRRAPDVVGLTMMSVDYNPATRAAEIVKEADPGIVTVVGGPHPTLVLREVAANPHFDYIVTHEGEITFLRLLQAIAEDRPPQERVLHGERPHLDEIPVVDRDLFLEEWHRFGYRVPSPEVPFVEELPAPFLTIIAGRGCVYNCNFCQPAEREIFGRFRQRSVTSVIDELEELRDRFQFASFMFHDDCLTNNQRWIEEFCQAYRDEGFKQPFFCQSRADIIVRHEGMVERMFDAGLRGFFIGFESGSDRMLSFLRKGTTREINLEAAEVCRRHGIKIWANYMLGLPTETREEVMETLSMLRPKSRARTTSSSSGLWRNPNAVSPPTPSSGRPAPIGVATPGHGRCGRNCAARCASASSCCPIESTMAERVKQKGEDRCSTKKICVDWWNSRVRAPRW
jgi:radical SAM superfamily enzyme YgiQ (UPF0313 family)